MGTEVDWKTIADRSGLSEKELIEKEKTSTTGKQRRVAEFNWSLFRKAVSLNGPTDIALTFADYLGRKIMTTHVALTSLPPARCVLSKRLSF